MPASDSGFVVPYEVRPSPIAGRGIFATCPIPRGTLIWRYSVGTSVLEHDEASLQQRLQSLSSEAEMVDLLEHVYVWDGKAIEILDAAKTWNHSASPNTGDHPDVGQGDGVSSYALRDIAIGEELTDDYALHDNLPWFEQLCERHGAISCLRLGRNLMDGADQPRT